MENIRTNIDFVNYCHNFNFFFSTPFATCIKLLSRIQRCNKCIQCYNTRLEGRKDRKDPFRAIIQEIRKFNTNSPSQFHNFAASKEYRITDTNVAVAQKTEN